MIVAMAENDGNLDKKHNYNGPLKQDSEISLGQELTAIV